MSIIEQVASNSITDLKISQDPDEALGKKKVGEFLDALGSNTSIETLKLDGDFIGCLRQDKRSALIKAIGDLPNLKEVHLGEACMLADDVASILTKGKNIVSMSLTAVVLQGEQSSLDACELAVYTHPTLKQFDLKDSSTAIAELSLDKLQEAGKKAANTPVAGGAKIINMTSAQTA